jgi:hypothetical protein
VEQAGKPVPKKIIENGATSEQSRKVDGYLGTVELLE